MKPVLALALGIVGACGTAAAPISLDGTWPKTVPDYDSTTEGWTRHTTLRGEFQEAVDLVAIFKSPNWRAAHADREASSRGLAGAPRDAVFAQAEADMAGPYEIEILFTTWNRNENNLDRGKRSTWRVALLDEHGTEIEPIEIVKDKRTADVLRKEFLAFGDFATAYVARFPRALADGTKTSVLGPGIHTLKLRISGERGGLEVVWSAP